MRLIETSTRLWQNWVWIQVWAWSSQDAQCSLAARGSFLVRSVSGSVIKLFLCCVLGMILTLKAMGLQRCVFLGPPKLVSSGSLQKGEKSLHILMLTLQLGELVSRQWITLEVSMNHLRGIRCRPDLMPVWRLCWEGLKNKSFQLRARQHQASSKVFLSVSILENFRNKKEHPLFSWLLFLPTSSFDRKLVSDSQPSHGIKLVMIALSRNFPVFLLI